MSRSFNSDSDIEQAIRIIKADYGDNVSVAAKKKNLLKFGRNPMVGTASTGYTLWFTGQDQANETYVERNLIDSISSSSASDNGSLTLTVEGHTVGDDISVSSLTQSAGTASCTTSTNHGFTTDDWVLINGANETDYNGIVKVTVTSDTSFTFSVDSGAGSPATGTITATEQNKTFVTQDVNLNGQTRVALNTPLARVSRLYVISQDRARETVGEIYIYENTTISSGKPTDTTKIHLTMPANRNQSEKAATTISQNDYYIVTSFRGSILEKSAAFADIALEIREIGGVFRQREGVSASGSGSGIFKFKPHLVVPKNADIRLIGIAGSVNIDISGSIQGYLASIVN